MNKRTKKTPCKPEMFLAKFRFQQSQNQIDFKPKNKPQEYHKKKRDNNCIRKFEMLFHEY
jgi:hypothetical protein